MLKFIQIIINWVKRIMGLLSASDLENITPPNLPPSWTGTPSPTFVAGVGGTYALDNNTFDPESDSLIYTLNGGSTAWPTGWSMASNGLITATTSIVEATTAGMLIDIDDGINAVVTSSPFSLIATLLTDQDLRDLGYILANDYAGVDSTGVSDSTSGLQDAFLDHTDQNKPLYLHADSVYRVTDTIRCNNYGQTDYICVHGGSNGAKPIIRLDDGVAAFNTGTERPVFVSRAHHSATWPNYPSNPLDNSGSWVTITGNMFGNTYINLEIDCGNNADAFGMYLPAAQRCFAANIKVDCSNAKGGIWSILGANAPMMNVEVIGGIWQIRNERLNPGEVPAGSMIAGLKLVADSRTTDSIIQQDFVPLVIVGFDITFTNTGPLWTVDAGGYNTSGSGQINFIDGIFRVSTGTMIDNTLSTSNGGSKNMYLRNCYVTGTDDLIQSGAEAVVSGTGTWKLINEYVYCDQNSRNAANGQYEQYNIIDGTINRTAEIATSISSSVSAPSVDYIARHTITIPMADSGPFINIDDEGASPVSTSEYGSNLFNDNHDQGFDSTTAIEAAITAAALAGHNRVMVPRGSYAISNTVALSKDTIFIGVHPWYSNILPHANWQPTSQVWLMETANDATGTCHMSNMGFITRDKDGTKTEPDGPWQYGWFSWVKWRTGKNSTSIMQNRNRQFVDPTFFTQTPRHYYTFQDNAGGKHYSLTEHRGRNWGGIDNRQIYISGTTQPLHLYGIAVEAYKAGSPQCKYNIEIRNSSNIRLYSSKREGDAPTCRYFNVDNVAFYGCGRQGVEDEPGIHIVEGTSTNVLIAPITRDTQNLTTDTGRSFVYQDVTAPTGVIRLNWPQGIAIYKLGTINDAAVTI